MPSSRPCARYAACAEAAALLLQQRDAQQQTGAETARLREELTALAADIRTLRERIAIMPPAATPGARHAILSDDEQAVRLETDRLSR